MSKPNGYPKNVKLPTECPFCGKLFDYTMYPEICIPGDNKLKKQVLNKTLFFPKCPYCNEQFKLKPRCIYRNEKKKEWFLVIDSQDKELETMLKTGDLNFNDIHTEEDVVDFMKGLYIRRIVHDVDSFREKILLSENNFDDRIIELMKLSLSGLIEKENNSHVYRIFLDETSGNRLDFVAIIGTHPPFDYITIKTETKVYLDYRDKYLHKLGRPEDDEYIYTDQKWAAKTGLLKDEDAGFVIPLQ